jgi:hypothetical protein
MQTEILAVSRHTCAPELLVGGLCCDEGGGGGPPVSPGAAVLASSFPLPHPAPPVGTRVTLGSFPLFSDFKLGKWAGGGMSRALPTLPRLCNPCCRAEAAILDKHYCNFQRCTVKFTAQVKLCLLLPNFFLKSIHNQLNNFQSLTVSI